MYMSKYPCVYMRGGTSKAVIFHKEDLPADMEKWDPIFMKVMGTPDVKQIDGMGGTVSSTSKVAVVAKSQRPDADVDFTFNQVDVKIANVDRRANCGNISSAIGPYAIDEGLVPAVEPETVVRIYNTNTKKIIEEHVQVEEGRAAVYGDAEIPGVPGTGSPIMMYFMDPAGAGTGTLFPTGNKIDTFDVPGYGPIEVTVFDCANTTLFIRAKDLGLKGTEQQELNQNKDVMEHIERIRGIAAWKCGFCENWQEARYKSTSLPETTLISLPQDYRTLDGRMVKSEAMDLCVRGISSGAMHKAYPVAVTVATGACILYEGTLANELIKPSKGISTLRLGHASGVSKVDIQMDGTRIIKGGLIRTARRIMDGYVYVRE